MFPVEKPPRAKSALFQFYGDDIPRWEEFSLIFLRQSKLHSTQKFPAKFPQKGAAMDIRTAICDDELTDREVVSQYLTRWAKEHGHTITLSMFSSAESFLFNFEDNKAYDLLLLDVEMSEINGVELAGRILPYRIGIIIPLPDCRENRMY